MTRPEATFPVNHEEIRSTITNIITNLSHDPSYSMPNGEEDLETLVERAKAGQEVEIPLVSGILTPESMREGHPLRDSLDGGFAFTFEQWLWDNGTRPEGTPSEELRDPKTGRLANPNFIAALAQTGMAVELSSRRDQMRGYVVVNNVWRLWKSHQVKGILPFFLPLATVRTVDADVHEIARWHRGSGDRFHTLEISHSVAVGKKLVILPDLELPRVS